MAQGENDPQTNIEKGEKANAKLRMATEIRQYARIARFKGATIVEDDGRWVDLTADRFAALVYSLFGDGINMSRVRDLEHLFRATAPDMSDKAHLIAFGDRVWDMRELDWTDIPAEDCVYRTDLEPEPVQKDKLKFILDLAMGDEGVYDDIMQSVAPLIMDKKPTGVIWFLGGGANGKSTLVHLLYKIFGPYLTEITVKQLEDERDTPQLNGKLGNVCKESSEGYVEDTRTYKSIGTHENFAVHKFHSQDMVEIEGNVHHIFSANNIPTFGDKSYGARRRTLVIPFLNRFEPDELFMEKTFTRSFISQFVAEMIRYALELKTRDYEYEFSPTTLAMKEKYDTDANTAQTYADELHATKVFGFSSYRQLQTDYENWCAEHGYRASGINLLRRAMDDKGYSRRSVQDKDTGRIGKKYLTDGVQFTDMVAITDRTGLFRPKSEADDLDNIDPMDEKDLLEMF